MSKRYTIEAPDGSEWQVVSSLEGYDGWIVRLEETGKRPDDLSDDEEFNPATRKWSRNADMRAKRQRQAQARDPEARGSGCLAFRRKVRWSIM
jgi:hypothetical protein